MEKILVVEDDQAISDLIQMNLDIAGYASKQVFNGSEALEHINTYAPDLVLLDINMPDQDGFEIMSKLEPGGIPVIFLTARNSITDKVKGLKLGADDYIVKPFESMELLARIEAVLRRYGVKKDILTFGNLEINLEERTVKNENVLVDLTLKEYELLLLLLKNKNKALSREKILELVWEYEYIGETRTVDIHIQKIRKKLGFEEVSYIRADGSQTSDLEHWYNPVTKELRLDAKEYTADHQLQKYQSTYITSGKQDYITI